MGRHSDIHSLLWASTGDDAGFGEQNNANVLSLYSEIGPGERIALSKVAVEHYERHNRPLRLAVDISIWSFQNQAALGGKNPELRTLYYRLIRLLSLCIQPLFVFDGPNKPPFKRGVKVNPNGAAYFYQDTKDLLSLFGFPIHQAPGEAEAECALLQRNGIVDAVLSEDVDTLMFGCDMHIRNWSSASTKGKTPTHVDLYRAKATKANSGLDREGMVLVAMMSGGDYLPGGIKGCGVKTACEAARGGFGTELCKLAEDDDEALDKWRDWLKHEIATNEGGYFERSKKALVIPDDFPDRTVLSYYTHPVTSSTEELQLVSQELRWDEDVNILQLRLFVAEKLGWDGLSGAQKFIRTFAPAFLIHQLRKRAGVGHADLAHQELEEKRLIKMIEGRRQHFETGNTPELRIGFVPTDLVKLNLDEERVISDKEMSTDSDIDERRSDGGSRSVPQSPRKQRVSPPYDPSQVQRLWVLESFVKIGVPLMAETWEESLRGPKLTASKAKGGTAISKISKPKSKVTDSGMKRGALDGFMKTSKPGVPRSPVISMVNREKPRDDDGHSKKGLDSSITKKPGFELAGKERTNNDAVRKKSTGSKKSAGVITTSASTNGNTHESDNPWTKSKRPLDTFNVKLPPGTRYSALGIYSPDHGPGLSVSNFSHVDRDLSQTDASLLKYPTRATKHARPTSNSSIDQPDRSRGRRKPGIDDEDRAVLGKAVINQDTTTADESEPTSSVQKLKQQRPRSRVDSLERAATPTASRKVPRNDPEKQSSNALLTSLVAQEVNRVLDLQQPASPAASPAPSLDSLPSPSLLFSPKPTQATRRSSVSPSPAKAPRKPKGLIMVRDSLPGAWRDVKPEEVAAKANKVMASVEVVDLT